MAQQRIRFALLGSLFLAVALLAGAMGCTPNQVVLTPYVPKTTTAPPATDEASARALRAGLVPGTREYEGVVSGGLLSSKSRP